MRVKLLPCSFEPSDIAWVSLEGFEMVFPTTGRTTSRRGAQAHDDPSRSERSDIEPTGGNVHVMANMINIVARGAALGSALGVLFTGVLLFGQHHDGDRVAAQSGTIVTASQPVHDDDDQW
ncbi:hypothetical protein [Streptomyces sp. HUAS TT20]|uniref:hypothetical protein n=1 Tax=Streptomyces sp. HUAS TT20 TaxID=3447509 RepID=UPI0021D9F9F1|nr:hypothetical protein [Streptomyces sp. HUAS 15-9]UXY30511.1 hypothetical protein N8I87_30820 [Streptomyces sp. HUAS 15-9]